MAREHARSGAAAAAIGVNFIIFIFVRSITAPACGAEAQRQWTPTPPAARRRPAKLGIKVFHRHDLRICLQHLQRDAIAQSDYACLRGRSPTPTGADPLYGTAKAWECLGYLLNINLPFHSTR